jgi:hypothetical protein
LPDRWLVELDPRSSAIAPIMLADGTPQPAGDMSRPLATYRDSLLDVDAKGSPDEITRTRIGDRDPSWRFAPDESIASFDYAKAAGYAPDAAYLRTFPGRYVPLYVSDSDASRLVILDLETGMLTWQSTPFERGAFRGFAIHGSRYFTNLRAADDTMLVINANTGKFDAVYQIAIGDAVGSPNALTIWDAPSPWSFQSGVLVGHARGAHYWMIDLEARRLQAASPGVKLVTPWQEVERVLGPLPRAIVI